MSMDRSLKSGGGLNTHRNVLTRAERIEKLGEVGKFELGAGDPLGLPKVANRKIAAGGKTKKKQEEGEEVESESTATG